MTKAWRAMIAGGVGGAVNAALCYFQLPVAIQESAVKLHWDVIPAGCAHGAVLALVAVAAWQITRGQSAFVRWGVVPLVAWLGGYVAWIPLDLSVSERSLVESLAWPAEGDSRFTSILWSPLPYFGAVAGLLYVYLLLIRRRTSRPWVLALGTSAAGTLGCLYWWIAWGPWYFSLIHGPLWGVPVGLALSQEADWED